MQHPSRRSLRYKLEVPAHYWSTESERCRGNRTRTRDISQTGVYFYGEFRQPLRSTFNFEIRLPKLLSGSGGILKGQGMLVRRDVLGKRRVGFAAEIFQYEFLSLEKARKKH